MTRISQSKILRNTLFKVWEGLTKEYREKVPFEEFYKLEMEGIINDVKKTI